MENPPIRILQRPCSIAVNKSSEDTRPPTFVKTLEQREADYAAARRRIMGSESSDSEAGDDIHNGSTEDVVSEIEKDASLVPRLPLGALAGNAAPLMSIHTGVIRGTDPISEPGSSLSPSTGHFTSNAVSSCPTHISHQGLTVVSVPQKLQHQPQINVSASLPVAPHQQSRILTTASSPLFAANSSRTQHPSPLFSSQLNGIGTPGLLPTPGFNYSVQNATLNACGTGVHYSYSATLALMHQFGLLQPQYQQSLNGFQANLLSPAFAHASPSANHAVYSSATPVPGPNHNCGSFSAPEFAGPF